MQDTSLVKSRILALVELGPDLERETAKIKRSVKMQPIMSCMLRNEISTATNPCLECAHCKRQLDEIADNTNQTRIQLLSCPLCGGVGQRIGAQEPFNGVHPVGVREVTYICGNTTCEGHMQPVATCKCP
jgi:hypothetical protein